MPTTAATPATTPGASPARISAAGIARAATAIDPAVRDTPLVDGAGLLAALGHSAEHVLLKLETLGPVRSFKGRGTDWFVARLLESCAARGAAPPALVCASAGNFGQGLAWAGARRGIPVTVFAATTANPLKVARMRALGAAVVLEGRDFDAAKDAARAHVAAAGDAHGGGALFVEDGREPAIAEGAGTIALELLRDAAARGLPAPDVLLVPLGNGALLAGIAHWVRAMSPRTRLVAVCAAGAPAMARSMAEGRAMARSMAQGRVVTTETVDTIADGIGVRVPVPEALDDLRGMVDEVRLVSDEAIVETMRLLWRAHGVVVEPAGAAGLAALVAEPADFRGATVATPLCGGNVTDEQVARWLLAP
jgi:threonine dehydratase